MVYIHSLEYIRNEDANKKWKDFFKITYNLHRSSPTIHRDNQIIKNKAKSIYKKRRVGPRLAVVVAKEEGKEAKMVEEQFVCTSKLIQWAILLKLSKNINKHCRILQRFFFLENLT